MKSRVRAMLVAMRGVVEGPSAFCERSAFWVNGKEVALFDETGRVLQLRLTREAIRALSVDERVTRRGASSDWIDVRAREESDLALIRRLARIAVSKHRAPRGVASKRPPGGADLERRRRFH